LIQAIVTDIEGTTSSLSFVKDVLFPYARRRVGAFVRANGHRPEVKRLLDDARAAAGKALDVEALIAALERWIDEDRKITPLKALQGLIWEHGYRNSDFQGHVYPDAVRQLRAWRDRGLALYVYSSGSVKAQQLLFAHTAFGDLTNLFSGYFDTTIGGKKEAESYRRIAQALNLPPDRILFLSDVKEELDAARTAGFAVRWLVREGASDADPAYPIARTFAEIET
jgi:enolase-phosphatase E1